jgi:hypothetical protein
MAAETAMRDAADADTVQCDPRINAGTLWAEELLDTPQIPQTLLANGTDEQHVRLGFDLSFVHRSQHGEDDGQATGIITDARRAHGVSPNVDSDVGALGEHRIEMGVEGHGSLSGAATP